MSRKQKVSGGGRGAREVLRWFAAMPKDLPDGVRALKFFDIPPELRNYIYEMVLCHDSPLQIIRAMLIHNRSNHIMVAMNARQKPRVPSAALLLSCRQIHSEATSIMYGVNKFCMMMGDIPAFVNCIGTSIKHLRHVTLQSRYQPQLLTSAMTSLLACENLKSITLETTGTHVPNLTGNAKDLAYLLVSWARVLTKAREGTAKPGPLKMLPLRVGPPDSYLPFRPVQEKDVHDFLEKLLAGKKSLRVR